MQTAHESSPPGMPTQRVASTARITEEAIHRAIVAHVAVRARPGVVYWHTPNGEARGPGLGGKLKALGTRAGMPDLMLLSGGRLYALELKRERGRLTDHQRRALSELEAAGAVTAVAYGLDDALGRLTSWGLLR